MFGYNFFNTLFPLVFFGFFIIITITVIKGLLTWNKNNKEPILNVNAKVVSKRQDHRVSSHNHNNHVHTTNSTFYYVTFQFDSLDRREFKVSGKDYGMIAEGDEGVLIFQGTRFISFDYYKEG